MTDLPQLLYRAEQVRELDAVAIETFGIPAVTLMERAGAAAFEELRRRWPTARRLAVLCGPGNNGGDGFVLARLAHLSGRIVAVYLVGDRQRLRGAALVAYQAMAAEGIGAQEILPERLTDHDVVVDGLLGTGLEGEVRGPLRTAIERINASGRLVLALDIPSGLNADTGVVSGAAIRADLTVTFIGLKQGFFTGDGPACCGEIAYSDLGVPADVFERVPMQTLRLGYPEVAGQLAPRRRTANKGEFGHVLVVGGEHGMAGAARMAAEAAARVGAGRVSLATRAAHAPPIAAARPEIMCYGIERVEQLESLLTRVTVVAIGPGLGQSTWGRQLWQRVLGADLPLVVDADALTLLSGHPLRREDWILTPHPGEAARLLGTTSAGIEQDRYAAAEALQTCYGGVCVLKGAGTIVRSAEASAVCTEGNPGMASGGMGDILTGVIAGLWAQGFDAETAARLGVCVHGEAGDRAAVGGERGLLATDLLPQLRSLVNPP